MSGVTGSHKSRKIKKKKDKLISSLADVRDRILTIALFLPEEKQDEIFLGIWSSKDLLAHLAGWDETNLKAAEEILSGNLPSFYAHSDKDWATYNSKLVAEYGRADFEELVAFLRQSHGRLLNYLHDLPANEIWKDRGIRAKGWKVTIGRLLEVEKEDEEEHYQQLKQFVETGRNS